MPELPEVASVLNQIRPAILGTRMQFLDVAEHLTIDRVTKKQYVWWCERALTYVDVRKVTQRGKYILIHLYRGDGSKRAVLVIHLGMSGGLAVLKPDVRVKHQHLTLRLTAPNGFVGHFAFIDPRRFGFVRVCTSRAALRRALSTTGPDVFRLGGDVPGGAVDRKLGAARFVKRLRDLCPPKRGMKQVLMDQSLVSGYGNIWAAEALFLRKINPLRAIKDVEDDELRGLYRDSVRMFNRAIDTGGATVSSFQRPDGSAGHAQDWLYCYGRGGLPCHICGTPISSATVGGRNTFWCSTCQK